MTLSWLMVRWMPGLPRRDAGVRSMISFGGNVAASYLIFNVNRNADNVLIGWHWGAGPLGLYSRAYNLLMLPVRQLSGPAGSVAVPAFSRIQSDPARFARLLSSHGEPDHVDQHSDFRFPVCCRRPVIVVVLGRQWLEAATVFQDSCDFCVGSTASGYYGVAACEPGPVGKASETLSGDLAHRSSQFFDRPAFRNQGSGSIRVPGTG